MAERRMFAKTIIDSDAFLDMPLSAQALYFHLSMRADDDGFINNPKKIQRVIGSSEDELKLLLAKKFILAFESGVIVIKHWKMHNYIRKDRYNPTVYQDEKKQLTEKENSSYTKAVEVCQPDDNQLSTAGQPDDDRLDTQGRLGKDSKEKVEDKPRKYSDEHFRLASKLHDNLKNDFSKKMEKVDLEKWADDIRLMQERDGRTIEQIDYILDWLPTDDFWFGNILSARKLRQQFEKLIYEVKKNKGKLNNQEKASKKDISNSLTETQQKIKELKGEV